MVGHADRREPLAAYCTGSRCTTPWKAPWDEAGLLAAMRGYVLPKIQERAPIRVWIVDDTGIPKNHFDT